MDTIWLKDDLLVASTQPVPQPKSTPLLEALKAEKSANKDKEAILRNHAHYNQVISPASRKEEKKKATPASHPQASQVSEGTSTNVINNVVATGSKKSSKKGQPHAQPPTNFSPVSKNSTDNPVTEHPKAAKAPRAPRVTPQSKNQSNNLSQNGTVDNADAAPSEAPARRSRPVIGLASRQFEAALSGVGGRERRARGERGKEKESSAPAGNDGPFNEIAAASSSVAILPSHGAGATASDEVELPPSPKKERTRRGGGRGGGGGGGAPVRISGILQRVDTAPPATIEQGVAEGSVDVTVTSTAATTATTGIAGSGSRGGGRRGRGRGHMKDKGVPPTVKSGS